MEPVRDRPDLAYALSNLQCLCGRCHARKTRIEVGHKPLPPERARWRDLLRQMARNPVEHERKSLMNGPRGNARKATTSKMPFSRGWGSGTARR
ncbi:HNH endonuclease signature motif containing protein [Chachezhania sediminis]|uniref:HNH endonuclease signature motif containing protein n=1 Tax=Chachezhania sediminis TaxID=2599291 RepID=UPI00131C6914|nr:HNH endonuclease signature motif containing protein [Chachezhania sediminis]